LEWADCGFGSITVGGQWRIAELAKWWRKASPAPPDPMRVIDDIHAVITKPVRPFPLHQGYVTRRNA